MLSHCRVCRGSVDFAFSAREMMLGLRESFDYLECRECGCLQISEIPAKMDPYYGDAYYTHSQYAASRRAGSSTKTGSASGNAKEKGHRIRALRRVLTRIRLADGRLARVVSGRRYGRFDWFRRTRTGPHDRILDVGCGSGKLLHRLHARGFDRLTGVDERLEHEGRPSSGLRFERVPLERHEGRYRLVMAHHSFEHMTDPVAAFAVFGNLVEPGGHLLLRLPLADSWACGHYGPDWVQLDAPRHLHLHTRKSLGILAAETGFRIVQVVDDSGPFQIWGSELYRRDIALIEAGSGGRRALGSRERLFARLRARRLARAGLGDQACFYLRRED